jgi:hypothetical protein
MIKYFIAAITASLLLSACGPKPVDEQKTIQPNETAFLIQLDGDTKKNQDKFKSVDYLEADKISAKRVTIPHKIVDLCPSCAGYDHQVDVPTMALYTVDRAPVSREWTSTADTGTTARNQAFHVESNESIDFNIGAVITAHVAEADTATFLYYYSGKQLQDIIDTNVRATVGGILAKEFAKYKYEDDVKQKNDVFTAALQQTQTIYKPYGITIDQLGYSEGMTPTDQKIQDSINAKFEATQQVGIADEQLQAAQKIAQASDAVRVKQTLEIQMKQVDIAMMMAQKWNGQGIMPQFIVSNNGQVGVNIPAQIGTSTGTGK